MLPGELGHCAHGGPVECFGACFILAATELGKGNKVSALGPFRVHQDGNRFQWPTRRKADADHANRTPDLLRLGARRLSRLFGTQRSEEHTSELQSRQYLV